MLPAESGAETVPAAGPTGSAAGTFRAAEAETAMRSEEVLAARRVTTEPAPGPAGAAGHPAWDPEVADLAVAEVAVAGAADRL